MTKSMHTCEPLVFHAWIGLNIDKVLDQTLMHVAPHKLFVVVGWKHSKMYKKKLKSYTLPCFHPIFKGKTTKVNT